MKTILSIFLLSCTFGLFGQKGNQDTAKIRKFEELRSAIIIEKLALTVKEQKEFLPLYNEYKQKEKVIAQKIRKTSKEANNEQLTDEQANELLKKLEEYQKEKATLFATYNTKFNTVLPAKKVLKLFVVEREIQRTLMKKVKESKGKK